MPKFRDNFRAAMRARRCKNLGRRASRVSRKKEGMGQKREKEGQRRRKEEERRARVTLRLRATSAGESGRTFYTVVATFDPVLAHL